MQQIQQSYTRRAILSLLAYDTDYRLTADVIEAALDASAQAVTRDALENELRWLNEQGFIALEHLSGITIATLTDRGLEIARGKSRAHGIRDLRPSEIHEMARR